MRDKMLSKRNRIMVILILMASFVAGCGSNLTAVPTVESTSTPPASSITATSTPQPSPTIFDLSNYAFPGSIDPTKGYLFYLHGKIIEDQGIPAISPDFGEYEYQAILEKLSGYGFDVISEQRAVNTDSFMYAKRVAEQVKTLLKAGVPAHNITVVGASKGGGIVIYVSNLLENREINYVLMAICSPDMIKGLEPNNISLYGNVLSIYDFADNIAGSCQDLFDFSEGKGISKSREVVLNVGTGHGVLYKPLDEWITPTVQWAGKP